MTSTSLNQSHTFPVLVWISPSSWRSLSLTSLRHSCFWLGFQYSFLLSWRHGQVIAIRDTVLIKYLTVNIQCCPLAQDCTRGRVLRAGQLFHSSRCRTAGNLAPAACEGPSPLLGRISSLLWLLICKWSWYPPQKGPSAQCRSASGVSCVEKQKNWKVGAPLHSPRSPIGRGWGCSTGPSSAGRGWSWRVLGAAAPGNGAHRTRCHLALRCPGSIYAHGPPTLSRSVGQAGSHQQVRFEGLGARPLQVSPCEQEKPD